MVRAQMVAAALVVLACGNSWASGQDVPRNTTTEQTLKEQRSYSRAEGPRTATFIPAFVLANVSRKQRQQTPVRSAAHLLMMRRGVS